MPTTLSSKTMIAERYRLERCLGQGGMGTVWQATHLLSGRGVAIKFLRELLAHRSDVRERFLFEARAALLVNHPHVIKIHEVLDAPDEAPAMVMSLLWGMTLRKRISRSSCLSLKEAADVMIQVAAGVSAAHARGIVHRDLKPENIFITGTPASPNVKILDFGIAKLVAETAGTANSIRTAPGASLGTPCYMSPEQALGERKLDYRSDIWAMGAILYELISGVRPVEATSLAHLMKQFTSSCITPIDCIVPDLPEEIVRLIMRMLAFDRYDRLSDLEEARVILARYSLSKLATVHQPLPPAARVTS